MNNFEIKVTENINFRDSEQKTFSIYKKNKKQISPAELRLLITKLQVENTKVRVRGLGIDRWHSLKGFEDNGNIEEDEEYYEGKVREVGKFADFSQIQITILKLK